MSLRLKLWPMVLVIAMSLPAIHAKAMQQSNDAADQPNSVKRVSEEIKVKMAAGLDPEGLASAPSAFDPPRMQSDTTPAVAEQTKPPAAISAAETPAAKMLVPRVAQHDSDDPNLTWDGIDSTSAPPEKITTEAAALAAHANTDNGAEYSMPQLRITSLGPETTTIHRSSQFRFLVANDGPVAAEAVNLVIGINGRGRVVSTYPQGAVQQDNVIYFSVGNLAVGDEREYGFEFQADSAGKINFTPRLTCSTTTQFSIDATAPQVDIQFAGQDQFVVGQQIDQKVIIRNISDETIRNVLVQHACSPSIAFENVSFDRENNLIDSLAPGQSHELTLAATTVQPGPATIKVVADGDNIRGTASRQLTITQSHMKADFEGPELIYLNSMGTYHLTVSNDQLVTVNDIKIRLLLPLGMVVKVIDRKAEFDAATSSITWTLPKLDPGFSETIPFKAVISKTGQHLIRATVGNSAGLMTHAQMTTHAVGRADIDLKVITNPEPIEIGSTTSIVIQVQNRGTHPATDVMINLELPESLTGIESADYIMDGQQIAFHAFQLAPGQSQNLTVPVTSDVSGDHIIRATVKSSASSKSIVAENSLFFFSTKMKRTANRDQR